MFFKFVCPTYMLANNYQAGINTLYEGAPHMLKHDMLATGLLGVVAQAAFNAAFLLISFVAPVFISIEKIYIKLKDL